MTPEVDVDASGSEVRRCRAGWSGSDRGNETWLPEAEPVPWYDSLLVL
jgi:hypothetical protein